jgi:endonuclease YncB( thermonuclease family)
MALLTRCIQLLAAARRSLTFWGIDAPEWDEAGGSAATDALRGLISGETLSCGRRDVDRYGRLVGQCALPDGRDLGAAMLATGTVDEYCRYSGNFYGRC